jgi:hypothetical protein
MKKLITSILLMALASVSYADEIADKFAISEMLAEYSYRWDTKASQEFADLFIDDSVLETWRGEVLVSKIEGKQNILEYAEQSHTVRLIDRQTRHHFSGLVFKTLSETAAVTENMALITHQTVADQQAIIRNSGIYRISWEKKSEGWKMSKRILFVDSLNDTR